MIQFNASRSFCSIATRWQSISMENPRIFPTIQMHTKAKSSRSLCHGDKLSRYHFLLSSSTENGEKRRTRRQFKWIHGVYYPLPFDFSFALLSIIKFLDLMSDFCAIRANCGLRRQKKTLKCWLETFRVKVESGITFFKKKLAKMYNGLTL